MIVCPLDELGCTCPVVVALFDFVEYLAYVRPNEWSSFEHILTPVASIEVSQLPDSREQYPFEI